MSKYLLVIPLLSLILSMTGCSQINEINDNNSKTVQEGLTKDSNAAIDLSVKNDVTNAVIAVQTFLASHPQANDLSQAPYSVSNPETKITIVGNWQNWKIFGSNSKTGYKVSYDSTTAQYT